MSLCDDFSEFLNIRLILYERKKNSTIGIVKRIIFCLKIALVLFFLIEENFCFLYLMNILQQVVI